MDILTTITITIGKKKNFLNLIIIIIIVITYTSIFNYSSRSRIGTETSVETSIENPNTKSGSVIRIDRSAGESFEEEMLRTSRDHMEDNHMDDSDDDPFQSPKDLNNANKNRQNSLNSSNLSGSNPRASLSAASSNESLHSESGTGSQTYHRYYHVFKEGELDYLINTYVDNLHIINSYYDHANWCIVAEKVNVWTI